jgi:flagellar hook-length control protein FliK
MSLENNRIEGKIFVENSNVKQMVEQSMQNLTQSLLQEGFASVNLQVALGGENRKEADTGDNYTFSGSRSGDLEKAVPAFDYFDMDERIINMIV